jgi:hypothetical protein
MLVMRTFLGGYEEITSSGIDDNNAAPTVLTLSGKISLWQNL